jgi:hypothetical protein
VLGGAVSVTVAVAHSLLDASGRPETNVIEVTDWTDVTAGATCEENTVLETATLTSAVAATRRHLKMAIVVDRSSERLMILMSVEVGLKKGKRRSRRVSRYLSIKAGVCLWGGPCGSEVNAK